MYLLGFIRCLSNRSYELFKSGRYFMTSFSLSVFMVPQKAYNSMYINSKHKHLGFFMYKNDAVSAKAAGEFVLSVK